MPFQIIRNDIVNMDVDAIVTAAGRHLHVDGGVNGAIHKAAGPLLQTALQELAPCEAGAARITPGFRLCRYIIHTVSPVWQGTAEDRRLLSSCYSESLKLAAANHCRSIAFPLIAAGAHGCPKTEALHIATNAINHFLLHNVPDNDLMVYLVLFSKESFFAGSKLFADIQQYIDDCYVDEHLDWRRENLRVCRAAEADVCNAPTQPLSPRSKKFPDIYPTASIPRNFFPTAMPAPQESTAWPPATLEDALSRMEESFSQMLQRLITEKGMKNADCYKKANIDKKLFSKIVNNVHYKPKKQTALALAVALELSLDETKELLMKAGLALSHSDKFDIIVEFFILKGKYDIFEINEMLYEFDQVLLGGALA